MVHKSQNNASSTSTPSEIEHYLWEYATRQKYSKWIQFKLLLYNPDDNTIFNRTPKGWGQLIVFYSIFFTVLAAMFAICMKVLMTTINEHAPSYQLDESLIGSNPGMGFRPMPPKIEEGSLIWFVASNSTNVKYWVDSIDNFLQVYTDEQKVKVHDMNRQVCDYDRPPGAGKVCNVDINSEAWGPCVRNRSYGYSSSSPCVFLKLNRIYGWVPEFYNDTKDLPEDMPDNLKGYIKKESDKLNTVWVSCHGEGPSDNEYIGPVDYYPQPGFPGYFYPYTNTDGYLSPLVAVHFKRPFVNRLINIECRVWAKNVYYGRNSKEKGSVRFEILVD